MKIKLETINNLLKKQKKNKTEMLKALDVLIDLMQEEEEIKNDINQKRYRK